MIIVFEFCVSGVVLYVIIRGSISIPILACSVYCISAGDVGGEDVYRASYTIPLLE